MPYVALHLYIRRHIQADQNKRLFLYAVRRMLRQPEFALVLGRPSVQTIRLNNEITSLVLVVPVDADVVYLLHTYAQAIARLQLQFPRPMWSWVHSITD